jgi:hypothetical protein
MQSTTPNSNRNLVVQGHPKSPVRTSMGSLHGAPPPFLNSFPIVLVHQLYVIATTNLATIIRAH